jgi:hypothetical protein
MPGKIPPDFSIYFYFLRIISILNPHNTPCTVKSILLLLCLACAAPGLYAMPADEKPRVVVLTDIENEPDDAQSLVRFLLYSNHFDVEALIATTSTHLRNRTAEQRIRQIVEAYGKVHSNLLTHEPGFPTAEYLHSVTKAGIPKYGMEGVGPGNDSEGSEWLIAVVDRDDPRPVWVTVWGGPNVLAQALWKVRQTRGPAAAGALRVQNAGLHHFRPGQLGRLDPP